MSSLRERMAEFGFESNDDYEYQVRCLMEAPSEGVRSLNIEGDSHRRKTAFATALADALEFPHVIYHDLSEQKPPLPEVILPPSRDEMGREEPPIPTLDQRFAEACGFSEAEDTILILDQLQAADFREHIRLYRFLINGEWSLRGGVMQANPRHLLVFMISEEPLYHSLQKQSFRLWVSSVSHRLIPYRPEEFGLSDEAQPVMDRLGEVFRELGMSPTRSEYARILHDIEWRVRGREELRHTIYGWTEGVDRAALSSDQLAPHLDRVVESILQYHGLQEVELTGLD